MRTWRLIVCWGLYLHAFDASAADIQVWGTGLESCAKWLSTPATKIAGNDWIMGFWTGENMRMAALKQGRANVGQSTDSVGILAEVENLCRQQPAEQVMFVAAVTYERLRQQGR